MVIGTYISIITLNINGLNAPTKRQRLKEWIQKQDPYICCLQETHFRPRDTYRLKVRGWKKIFHANGNQKKAGVAILISDTIEFGFFLTFLLEYNCFTTVCQFLLYNKVNQLYIYIYPHISSLFRLPPSHPPNPTLLAGHKAPS